MTDIDPKLWFDIFQTAVMGLLAVSVWLRRPGEDAGKAVSVLRDEYVARVQGVDTRLATIDEKLKNVPTSRELAELEGNVKTISQQVIGISDGMTRQTKQLDRIEDYLLNANNK